MLIYLLCVLLHSSLAISNGEDKLIYQLLALDMKRTCNRKFMCSNDNSGKLNKREMLLELCHKRGLLLIGSKDQEPILEDINRIRFRAKFRADGEYRWMLLSPYKAVTLQPIANIFAD